VHVITPGGALQQPAPADEPEPTPERIARIVADLAPVVPPGSTWQVVLGARRR
jgi:hypothetical protein